MSSPLTRLLLLLLPLEGEVPSAKGEKADTEGVGPPLKVAPTTPIPPKSPQAVTEAHVHTGAWLVPGLRASSPTVTPGTETANETQRRALPAHLPHGDARKGGTASLAAWEGCKPWHHPVRGQLSSFGSLSLGSLRISETTLILSC